MGPRLIKRYFDKKAKEVKGSVMSGNMEALKLTKATPGAAAAVGRKKASAATSPATAKAASASSPAALSSDAILDLLAKGCELMSYSISRIIGSHFNLDFDKIWVAF